MKILKLTLCALCLSLPLTAFGQDAENTEAVEAVENTEAMTSAYISDNLFIYMHAGPGTNYRIVGSINAGDEIKLTGEQENGYTNFIDSKGRSAWVESKFVSDVAGLRAAITELNAKLAEQEQQHEQTKLSLEDSQTQFSAQQSKEKSLQQEVTQLTQELESTKAQVSSQDLELKKQYFFNGAIVLGVGLILGLLLPRLAIRRRTSMESWK